MKILVFGANGQLGADIVGQFTPSHHVVGLTHDDLDIAHSDLLRERIQEIKPDVIINTTAFHNVEWCEQQPETAEKINVIAPTVMADEAKKLNARFIHFSTDYVFDGNTSTPYKESDEAKPLNVYGKTKLQGEQSVLAVYPKSVVIRISGLYGTHPCRAKNGLNFVQLMLKLAKEKGEVKVVDDEFVSPTYAKNVAQQVEKIIASDLSGVIHSTSEGFCSWNAFANEIFTRTGTHVILNKASSKDFPAKVPRPNYSVLENSKLIAAGINVMLPWQEALQEYLNESGLNRLP